MSRPPRHLPVMLGEIVELLAPALDLRKRFGLDFRVAMQTDVPGAVVGLCELLAAVYLPGV